MNRKTTRGQTVGSKKTQRNWMLFLVLIGFVFVAVGIGMARSGKERAADPALIELSGQPSLKVDQDVIDLGELKLNTRLDFEIQVTNVGDQPLEISAAPYIDVREGC